MEIDVAGQLVSLPALLLLGVVVGFLAGMFGVGGGFLLTPLLSVALDVPITIAVGTGLCQMVGTATVALLRHRRLQQGEPRVGVVMVAGSLVGVIAGARTVAALQRLGEVSVGDRRIALVTLVLYLAFTLFLVLSAAAMWQSGTRRVEELEYVRRGPLARVPLWPAIDLPNVPLSRVSALVIAYSGLALGFVSGLLGVGGGIAMIPLLVYGFGFPIRHAAGTGISLMVVTAACGTVVHSLQGHVHLGMAMLLLVGASVSAQLGALLTRRLPAGVLRRGFVTMILAAAAAVIWDLARQLL
jgi:uncharacterized membrane protein YfcA